MNLSKAVVTNGMPKLVFYFDCVGSEVSQGFAWSKRGRKENYFPSGKKCQGWFLRTLSV